MKVMSSSALKKILFLLCLMLSVNIAIATTKTITIQQSVADSLKNIPTTNSDFSNQYLTPMVSDSVKLKTPSGTEFDGALMCKSSSAFLKISAIPGSTGDLTHLYIQRDTNFDGTLNVTKTFPKPVSGICANGIITCNAGTWDKCLGYKWNADNDNLSLIATGIGNLGGCYCINDSCSSAGLSKRILPSIMKDIGGAAAQVLANSNPQYTISEAVAKPLSVEFYGQKLVGCQPGNISKLAKYQANPQNIETEANTLKIAPGGLYQLVANSALTKDSLATLRSCNINRSITQESTKIEDIISFNGGIGGMHRCQGTGCLELVLGKVGDNYWGGYCSIFRHNVSFYVDKPERVKRAVLIRAKWDDWIRVSVNKQKIYAHPYPLWDGKSIPSGWGCEWGTSWDKQPNVDFTSLLKQKGKIDFQVDVQVAGGGEGYAYAQIFVDESCEPPKEYISNGCDTIKQDTNCKVKNEWIDSVQTYRNFNPTGKTPITTAKKIGSCGTSFPRTWWNIKREYECLSPKKFDLTQGLKRSHVMKTSLKNNQYDDLIGGITTSRNINIPNIPIKSCTNACKVRRVKSGSTVTTGFTTGINSSPTAGVKSSTGNEFETLYRKCTGSNQNICPNESGETVLKGCGCLNEFSEVSSMMNAMRYAAQDMICTTGTQKGF